MTFQQKMCNVGVSIVWFDYSRLLSQGKKISAKYRKISPMRAYQPHRGNPCLIFPKVLLKNQHFCIPFPHSLKSTKLTDEVADLIHLNKQCLNIGQIPICVHVRNSRKWLPKEFIFFKSLNLTIGLVMSDKKDTRVRLTLEVNKFILSERKNIKKNIAEIGNSVLNPQSQQYIGVSKKSIFNCNRSF